MIWTEEKLRALSVADRHEVWRKATAKGLAELVAMVEGCGKPYTETACLHADDPDYLELCDVIFGPAARDAGVRSTTEGLPAMAGIDLLIQQRMGQRYGRRSMDTAVAGALVAEMMRSQGYTTTGRKGKLAPPCLAKTAEIYAPLVKKAGAR